VSGLSAPGQIEWSECLLEPRPDPVITRYIRERIGVVPDFVDYFTPVPWVARLCLYFLPSLGLVHTRLRLGELILLVVSQDNSCRYCVAAGRAILLILGLSPTSIRAVEQDLLTAHLDRREQSALDFARRLSRMSPPPTPRDLDALRAAGWSAEAANEIVGVAALAVLGNRFATLPAIPTAGIERIGRSRVVRLLAPLLRRRLERRARRPDPQGRTSAIAAPHFSRAVNRLGDVPAAGALTTMLAEAWQSPVLLERTKALVFAVIARALGSVSVEREAREILQRNGLASSDVDSILDHLRSPTLDAAEAAIVPFARDTVRYETSAIQRRSRTVQAVLGTERFIELIGTAALANCICRLATVLDAS
jgi:AhpD family alkylhydroperoxidase